MRPVPSHIVRPEYVGKPTANEGNDSNMYTPEEVEKVRAAGKIAAGAIVEASKICVPGTTTDEITSAITAPTPRPWITAATPSPCAPP